MALSKRHTLLTFRSLHFRFFKKIVVSKLYQHIIKSTMLPFQHINSKKKNQSVHYFDEIHSNINCVSVTCAKTRNRCIDRSLIRLMVMMAMVASRIVQNIVQQQQKGKIRSQLLVAAPLHAIILLTSKRNEWKKEKMNLHTFCGVYSTYVLCWQSLSPF